MRLPESGLRAEGSALKLGCSGDLKVCATSNSRALSPEP